jgi:putative nucleotidyltransferase with HDIG domain
MVGVCEQFNASMFPRGFVEGIWNHSIQTASIARMIAESEHTSLAMAEQSFVAGLLHDIGKLILAENFSKSYAEVLEFANALQQPVWQAEKRILKATHADVGAYLLDLWGLPEAVTRAVAMHHEPVAGSNEHITPLTIVHAANKFAHELAGTSVAATELNTSFLEKTELTERVHTWREVIDQTAAAAMA